jgi:alkanesulfonate monooxygenase SsuD/methylene tetrahydromethanopterin reductase-like flavin-dependent oxidoreductase (luciferase family)
MTGCLVWALTRRRSASAPPPSTPRARRDLDGWLARIREIWVVGTPERARERLEELADAGVEQVMLQHAAARRPRMLDVAAALRG